MGERKEKSPEGETRRVNLYLSTDEYEELDLIAKETRYRGAGDVVRRFIHLGNQVWEEGKDAEFSGLYIKKGGQFIRLPFLL